MYINIHIVFILIMSNAELILRIVELEKQNYMLQNQLREANAYLKMYTPNKVQLTRPKIMFKSKL